MFMICDSAFPSEAVGYELSRIKDAEAESRVRLAMNTMEGPPEAGATRQGNFILSVIGCIRVF